MKLLILTQKADMNDSGLGFFHRWIVELAKSFETLVVVCLEEGTHDFPANVRVISLGKDKLKSGGSESNGSTGMPVVPFRRFRYVARFYSAIWRERHDYDSVFVHMNEEYVLLGGLFWRSLRKKIFLWRNHPNGSWMTRLAVALSHKVFSVSDFAYVKYSPKAIVMPAGIDMQMFKDVNAVREPAVLSLGRLSPVKRLETIVAAWPIKIDST
jgi:glycosyltransferase involved in cell wall biosynthesis